MFYQEKTKQKSFLNNFPKSVHFYGLTAIQVYFSRPSMTHLHERSKRPPAYAKICQNPTAQQHCIWISVARNDLFYVKIAPENSVSAALRTHKFI